MRKLRDESVVFTEDEFTERLSGGSLAPIAEPHGMQTNKKYKIAFESLMRFWSSCDLLIFPIPDCAAQVPQLEDWCECGGRVESLSLG